MSVASIEPLMVGPPPPGEPLGTSLSSPPRPDILDLSQLLAVNNSSWGHLWRGVDDAEATCLAATCDATLWRSSDNWSLLADPGPPTNSVGGQTELRRGPGEMNPPAWTQPLRWRPTDRSQVDTNALNYRLGSTIR